jgi:hypothetical protein
VKILVSLILLALASCEPVYAGFTLFTRDQVSPPTIMVQRGPQIAARRNPGPPPAYPATFTRMICTAPGFSIYSTAAERRVEVWSDTAGTATDAQVLAACPLREDIIVQIKDIRAAALERAAKGAGVLAVYSENYSAATAMLAGAGDSTIMKDGQTAANYLAGFGARLGMTAAQFATYIIRENRRIGPEAYQVEDEYLRLAYGVIPAETSVDKLLAYPGDYRRFCGL